MVVERSVSAVTDYAPTPGVAEALQYPFDRPDTSFITDGKDVTFIFGSKHEGFVRQTNDFLADKGLAPLDKRVAVVAFGSNASPYQLKKKMSAYGNEDMFLTQVVPNECVVIPDTVVAWHGKPGQNGSTFAELYKGDDTQGKRAHAMVQYFTKEQLAIMHTTEGETYRFAPVEVVAEDGTPIQAFAYVAAESQVLRKGGQPVEVAFSSDATGGKMTAEEAVDYMLAAQAGDESGIRTAKELVAANTGAKLAEKKQRQEQVRARLAELGMSTEYSHPAAHSFVRRADFSAIENIDDTPGVLHLLEEYLAGMRPTTEVLAQRAGAIQQEKPELSAAAALRAARRELDVVADPVRGLRRRATVEIGKQIGSTILEPGEWSGDGTREVNGEVWKKVKIGPNSYRIMKENAHG